MGYTNLVNPRVKGCYIYARMVEVGGNKVIKYVTKMCVLKKHKSALCETLEEAQQFLDDNFDNFRGYRHPVGPYVPQFTPQFF
jgi:hypothetical protein